MTEPACDDLTAVSLLSEACLNVADIIRQKISSVKDLEKERDSFRTQAERLQQEQTEAVQKYQQNVEELKRVNSENQVLRSDKQLMADFIFERSSSLLAENTPSTTPEQMQAFSAKMEDMLKDNRLMRDFLHQQAHAWSSGKEKAFKDSSSLLTVPQLISDLERQKETWNSQYDDAIKQKCKTFTDFVSSKAQLLGDQTLHPNENDTELQMVTKLVDNILEKKDALQIQHDAIQKNHQYLTTSFSSYVRTSKEVLQELQETISQVNWTSISHHKQLHDRIRTLEMENSKVIHCVDISLGSHVSETVASSQCDPVEKENQCQNNMCAEGNDFMVYFQAVQDLLHDSITDSETKQTFSAACDHLKFIFERTINDCEQQAKKINSLVSQRRMKKRKYA